MKIQLTTKDYTYITIIGVSFALFSIPILKNIDLPFIEISFFLAIGLALFFIIFANVALWISSIIGGKIPVVFQVAKFGAIGAFNTFLDWGIFNTLLIMILESADKDDPQATLFKFISFSVATVGSYFWNKSWTFEKKDSDAREFGKFILISSIGAIINVAIFYATAHSIATTEIITSGRLLNIAAGLATVMSLIWNFIGYKFFVFMK